MSAFVAEPPQVFVDAGCDDVGGHVVVAGGVEVLGEVGSAVRHRFLVGDFSPAGGFYSGCCHGCTVGTFTPIFSLFGVFFGFFWFWC